MAKRSWRCPVQHEKEQVGCIWGLISIFDFRHGRTTQKLISDTRHGSRHADGVAHSRTKANNQTNFEEKWSVEDGEESQTTVAKAVKTSVKELMQEEMINDECSKRQIDNIGVELKQIRNNCRQTNMTNKKSDVHICDLEAARNMEVEMTFHQVAERKPSTKPDLGNIMEELQHQIHQKGTTFMKHKGHDDLDVQLNKINSVSEEKLSAAIEVFMDLRVANGKHLVKDGKGLCSNEFMGALHALSANKELFLKLLEDPNSQLVKLIKDMEDAQLEEGPNSNLLIGCTSCKDDTSNLRPDELINHKRPKFFRRRSKSRESFPLGNETFQASTKIVILKPGAAGSQNSNTDINVSKSLQSHCNIERKTKGDRNASPFSFTEIKRKLKSAMGKEQRKIASEGTIHWFPNEHQNLKNSENCFVVGNGRLCSPSRNHFYTEKFAKPSPGIKKSEHIGILKNSDTSMVNETAGYPKQEKSSIYIEAKKHLSEMLTNGDEDAKLITGQLPKTLGRILPPPEDNFSSSCSPERDRELSFMSAKLRLSPHSNPRIFNENVEQLIQDNHAIHLSSPWKKSEKQACTTDDNSKEEYNSSPDVLCELNHDGPIKGALSSKAGSGGVPEIGRTANAAFEENNKILNASCEPSSSLVTSDFQNCHSAVVASPSTPLLTREVKDPESFIDQMEWPNPTSVSKPFGAEDDVGAMGTTIRCDELAIQPVRTHLEEQGSSASDQGIYIKTCMEDKESTFEYVEAVLLGSGLNWDEFLLRWISSDQLLDLSVFDEVEMFFNQTTHEKKVLFDCANEVLSKICKRSYGGFPGASNLKNSIRPVPKGMNLICEVWQGVEWNLLQQLPPHCLDQLIRKDMEKSGTWMDLGPDIEHISIELGEAMLDELMEDIIRGS